SCSAARGDALAASGMLDKRLVRRSAATPPRRLSALPLSLRPRRARDEHDSDSLLTGALGRHELAGASGGGRLLGHAEVEALAVRDAEAPAFLEVLGRLDAFRDALGVDAAREVDEHLDDVALDRVGVEARHERVGDLQEVRAQLGDGLERRVAGSGIVDRDPEALAPQGVERGPERRNVADGGALRDLEHDAVAHPEARRPGP